MEHAEHAKILERISGPHPDAVTAHEDCGGDLQITVAQEGFIDLMRFLHDDDQLHFDLLIDVLSIDNSARHRQPRFEVVYVLVSTVTADRLLVKLPLAEDEDVPTVTDIWPSANWPEREVYDLMGIRFAGHPDLRRILTWDGFEGHPLRKEFPLLGKDFDKKWDPSIIENNLNPDFAS